MYKLLRLLAATLSFMAAFALASLSVPSFAGQPNWRMCVHNMPLGAPTGNPPVWSGGPTLDGVISSDLGWTRAWRYVFNNGTPIHDVAVQAVADATNLYLSFEINNDHALSVSDMIVLAVDPGGGAAQSLLNISPLLNGSVNPTPQILYWSSLPAIGGGSAPPANTKVVTTKSGGGSNNSWFVEMQLPLAAYGISAAADFGLYLNVVVNQGPGTGPTQLVNEYAWPVPASNAEWLTGDPTTPPPLARWGTATVAGNACNGVSIAQEDIVTTNAPPNKIIIGHQNTFNATVRNTSVDPVTGLPTVIAHSITAKFKFATFGLPSEWNDIVPDAGSTNPAGPTDVPANGAQLFSTLWTVPTGDPRFPDDGHTCIMVELDTTAVGGSPWVTTFANRSNWNNFTYALSSSFESAPVIDTKGWDAPAAGNTHDVDLLVTSRINRIDREIARQGTGDGSGDQRQARGSQGYTAAADAWDAMTRLVNFPAKRDESYQDYAGKLQEEHSEVSQLVYLLNGCRRSGKFITIAQQKQEICEREGSYGFVVRHAGLGEIKWNTLLSGPGVEHVEGNDQDGAVYRVKIDAKGAITLHHRFEAQDGGGWPIWLLILALLVLLILIVLWRRKRSKGTPP